MSSQQRLTLSSIILTHMTMKTVMVSNHTRADYEYDYVQINRVSEDVIARYSSSLIQRFKVRGETPEECEEWIVRTYVALKYFSQAEQRAFNTSHGIETEAWSPLGRASSVLQDPALVEIAERLDRSVSAVILRWHYQLGVVPLPKANSPERQRENLQIFDFNLDRRAMYTISALSRPEGRIANQDPALYEEL